MVTLTEIAAKKVGELRLEEGKPEWGLRIRVVGGGCSGMSYELGWEDEQAADDNVIEAAEGIRVFIDQHSAPYLSGIQTEEPRVFVGPMNQLVKAEAGNYYLSNIFGEKKLTIWINLAAGVLLTLIVGGAL